MRWAKKTKPVLKGDFKKNNILHSQVSLYLMNRPVRTRMSSGAGTGGQRFSAHH